MVESLIKTPPTPFPLRIVLLGCVGGFVEYFDFIVFAIYAKYLSATFFPDNDPSVAVLKTFVVFAIGYIARPIGGFVLSHIGDRSGRKKTFSFSIFLMGVSTLMMGFLPGYSDWGLTSSLLFVFLRVLQGLAMGGDLPIGANFVMEHAQHKAPAACGLLYALVYVALILANGGLFVLSYIFSPEQMTLYGWRVIFCFGGTLAIVTAFLRSFLKETPSFLNTNQKPIVFPLKVVFRDYKKPFLVAFLLASLVAIQSGLLFVYMPTFLMVYMHWTQKTASFFSITTAILGFPALIFISALFTQKRIKTLILISVCCVMVTAPVFYYVLQYGSPLVSLGVFCCLVAIPSLVQNLSIALYADLFPTPVRLSGVCLAYNLANGILGGLTPGLASWWMLKTHSVMGMGFIISAFSVLGLLALAIGWRLPVYLCSKPEKPYG